MSGSAHHQMSSALSWAAAAWARDGQTGRLRHQGTGREIREKTQVQTWVCDYSLPVSRGQPSPAYTGRLWAQYWVFTTQWPRHRRAESFTACESRICWIWSAASQLSQLTSELSRVFITQTTETCCCFSEVSDSCQQQQQQQQQHQLTLGSPASDKWLVSTYYLHKVT